jgi:hypothetical protein
MYGNSTWTKRLTIRSSVLDASSLSRRAGRGRLTSFGVGSENVLGKFTLDVLEFEPVYITGTSGSRQILYGK